MISEPQLQKIGILILLSFLLTVISNFLFTSLTKNANPLNAVRPLLALEFADELATVKSIVGTEEKTRKDITKAQLFDTIFFVPLYCSTLLLMSWLLAQGKAEYAVWLGILAGAMAIIGGISDWCENLLSILAINSEAEWAAQNIRLMASIKWAAIFISIGTLSAIFWQFDWRMIFGGLLILTAILGFGIFIDLKLITGFFLLEALSLLSIGLSFVIKPEWFMPIFNN